MHTLFSFVTEQIQESTKIAGAADRETPQNVAFNFKPTIKVNQTNYNSCNFYGQVPTTISGLQANSDCVIAGMKNASENGSLHNPDPGSDCDEDLQVVVDDCKV